jgi:exopolysaccharide biosynthesis polyprenyl glycosylphosphotransferase
LHFIISYIPRAVITSRTIKRIHKRKIGFNTLIIGGQDKAVEVYNEIESQKRSSGNKFVGFIPVNNGDSYPIQNQLPKLGSLNQVLDIIKENDIQEVIIAIEYEEHEKIGRIISKLEGVDIIIKVIPSMYDILTGMVKMTSIIGTPLIEISHHLMPVWQQNFKVIIDKIISLLSLIILLPVSIALAISIKMSSKGPVIYSHERLGKYGKPFKIFKFRSMYVDAESNGPQLSSEDDTRVTRIGRFMRKARLDEIPNFINVLKGEMSLVGPRPERQFYVDQIITIAPHYLHLQKVKPGITSWGQVKFGYATTIDEMVKRLKYDLIYIENMTLYVDLKILIYTLLTIVKGKGL